MCGLKWTNKLVTFVGLSRLRCYGHVMRRVGIRRKLESEKNRSVRKRPTACGMKRDSGRNYNEERLRRESVWVSPMRCE